MKRTIILAFLIGLLAVVPAVQGQPGDPAVTGGTWLVEQQLENGSFDDEIGLTSLSVVALATIGETNQPALDWLEMQVSDELALDEASVMVMALAATGTDMESFADGVLLSTYSGLLRQARGESIDGMCLGLIARVDLGLALPGMAVGALVGFQNDDGGFGPEPGAESDIVSTSLCIHVLAATETTEALDLALGYLAELQLEDGGWSFGDIDESDALGTAFAMHALIAADEALGDWGLPMRVLLEFQDSETGGFVVGDGSDAFANQIATAVAIPVFRGRSLISFAPMGDEDDSDAAASGDDGPALDANWALVGDGFQMAELNTADDFFVTVVDPFTEDELYGIEIINWTAEYQYTGYIVQQYLTADILIWMAEQDPTVWENISVATLALLPPEELAELPVEVQARVAE